MLISILLDILIKTLKSFYRRQRFIINLILIIILVGFLVNLFVNKNQVLLSGESLFSFDYTGHVSLLFNNYIINQKEYLSVSKCEGCPNFYNYSVWSSFWVVFLLSLGQRIGLYPFIFFILITVCIQTIFLYIFCRLVFKDFNRFAFIIASVVFIFNPHMIYQVPSATLDGVIFGFLVGSMAFWLYILLNFEVLDYKKLILPILGLGFTIAFFFNIGISHLPLALYSLLLIGIPFYLKVIKFDFIRFISVISGILFTVFILNFPIIISQLINGNAHYLTTFNKMTIYDSLSAGFPTAGVDGKTVSVFFIIIIILFFVAKLKLKIKLLLLGVYIFTAFLMTGAQVGVLSIYEMIFKYMPLMDHERSLHRFIFFEVLIIFITIYIGLRWFVENSKYSIKQFGLMFGLVFVCINVLYINNNINIFHTGIIPPDYQEVKIYLKANSDRKIYFPFNTESISGNLIWLPERHVRNSSIYPNPFTSLYMLQNMVSVEGYQLGTVEQAELSSLIDYSNLPESLDQLSFMGIKYLILDKNYLWKTNYPLVNLDTISSKLKLDKQFGNIYIYNLPDSSSQCKSSYGDYMYGFCTDFNNPRYLINKSDQDFMLDKLSFSKNKYLIQTNKNVRLENLIVNSDIRLKVINNKIIIPYTIYQADNQVDNIFSKKIEKGLYKLFVPILKLSASDKIFKDSIVNVTLNSKILSEISPYSVYQGLVWEDIDINSNNSSVLAINTKGHGTIIIGAPLLVPTADWNNLQNAGNHPALQIISTYGDADTNLNVSVNSQKLNNSQQYNSWTEIDFLSDQFKENLMNTGQFKTSSSETNGFSDYTTTTESNILKYYLDYNKKISSLKFIIGTAYIDSDNIGEIRVLDSKGKMVYKSNIYKKDIPYVNIDVPASYLRLLNSSFNVELVINKKNVLLYQFTSQIKFEK